MPKPLGNVAKLIKSCGAHSTVADNWIVVVKFVGRDELGGGGSDKTWLEMYEQEEDAAFTSEYVKKRWAIAEGGGIGVLDEDVARRRNEVGGRCMVTTQGMSNGSLSAIHADWRRDLHGLEGDPPPTHPLVGQAARVALPIQLPGSPGVSEETVEAKVVASPAAGWLEIEYAIPGTATVGRTTLAAATVERAFAALRGADVTVDLSLAPIVLGGMEDLIQTAVGPHIVRLDDLVATLGGAGSTYAPSGRSEAEVVRAARVLDMALDAKGATPVSASALTAGLSPRARGTKLLQMAGGSLPPPGPRATGNNPRAAALQLRAKSGAEFDQFLTDVTPWYVEPARLASVMAYVNTSMGALERWLKKMGDLADPALLAGPPGTLDAGELQEVCSSLDERAQARKAASTGGGGGGGHGGGGGGGGGPNIAPIIKVQAPVAINTTGTDAENRERSTLLADAMGLDSAAEARLYAMEAAAAAQQPDRVSSLVSAETDIQLTRLLESGEEVHKAIAGHVPQRLELALLAVRGSLERRLERAVLGDTADSAPDRVLRAVRWVRLGRLGKVRLLHLLDHEDKGTDDDPLASFGAAGEARALFSRAISRMQMAATLARPMHSGQTLAFFNRLQTWVDDEVARGVPWAVVSTFYRALMRKVDTGH